MTTLNEAVEGLNKSLESTGKHIGNVAAGINQLSQAVAAAKTGELHSGGAGTVLGDNRLDQTVGGPSTGTGGGSNTGGLTGSRRTRLLGEPGAPAGVLNSNPVGPAAMLEDVSLYAAKAADAGERTAKASEDLAKGGGMAVSILMEIRDLLGGANPGHFPRDMSG